jgi:4-amino-4-deoxy-L-arabinose transferase-like glycosyltransferase
MLDAMTGARAAAPVRAVVRAERGAGRLVDSRWTVAVAALAAFLLRLPGLTRPLRADEAGFELVARAWHPTADSVYGPYFVDRPPPLIALFKVSDAIGGPLFIRVLGAVACAALVLAAAAVARLVADEHAARWTAVAMAALSTNVLIDAVAVKGELLALPVLMGSLGLSLLAVRDRSWPQALLAGLLAGLALGLKQNLVGGVVFAAVLYLGAWRAGRLDRADLVRLAAAASAGFAVPVALTVGWALAAGVRLHTLWYAVYGFRFDASRVLSDASDTAPTVRAGLLVVIAVGAGMLLIIGGFVVHVRDEWRADAPLTAAIAALLAVDVVGLGLGGSFWRDYLFPLLPGTALCAALLARRASRRGIAMRAVITAAAASTVLGLVGWVAFNASGLQEYDEHDTGTALAEVAAPDDTLVVYGGRADVQLESGMGSPYAYLWSLPMRTLDPELAELRALVGGDRPPTWIVEWVGFRHWDEQDGARLEQLVGQRYVRAGTACGDRAIWLLRGVDRATPRPVCHGTSLTGQLRTVSSGP